MLVAYVAGFCRIADLRVEPRDRYTLASKLVNAINMVRFTIYILVNSSSTLEIWMPAGDM
jgi:hypothetical protein